MIVTLLIAQYVFPLSDVHPWGRINDERMALVQCTMLQIKFVLCCSMNIRPQDFPWALVNPLVARDVQPNRPLLLAQYGYIPNKKKGRIDKTAQYLSKSTNITTNIAMLSKEGVRRCSISLHFVLETSRHTRVSAPNPCAQRIIFDGKYSTCDMFAVVVWSQ